MLQRTCRRPESVLKTAGPALRRRGAPFDGGICPLSVLTGFPAQRLRPACQAPAAGTAHIAFGRSRPVDPSLAPLRAGVRQHRRWPAGDAGDAVPCAV
jgi:hypothetical protein